MLQCLEELSGIRCNSVEDIVEIKKSVRHPIIGIIKAVYENSNVYITPTMKEVDALVACGCEIIATDATNRPRPKGVSLFEFFKEVRLKYPNQLFMADCSTYKEGMYASELGFDIIGTTMYGYTEYTKGTVLPNVEMISTLVHDCRKPVIAEGGIWSPADLEKTLEAGAFAAVVGSAITRPMLITERFAKVIEKKGRQNYKS